jgi:hypothetical protein
LLASLGIAKQKDAREQHGSIWTTGPSTRRRSPSSRTFGACRWSAWRSCTPAGSQALTLLAESLAVLHAEHSLIHGELGPDHVLIDGMTASPTAGGHALTVSETVRI